LKQKVGISIDADILQLTKERAAEEGRPISDLVQAALVRYLWKAATIPNQRKLAYQLFCERPMKVPAKQLRHVFKEELWDL
jgi:hypothetical protein